MKIFKNMVLFAALLVAAPISAETTSESDSTAPEPAAPATVEEIAAGTCAGCHNADGNSVIPMNPILAGQHPEYITKQLMDFKANGEEPPKRNSPVMSAMVAALSQEDMKGLGEYYAKQKANPSQAPIDEKLIEAGKVIYHGGNIENGIPACASCHGPDGSGIPPHYPAVAGQHAEYTLSQLDQFNKGDRANDNAVMQQVVSRMSANEKRAVSAYIATIR
ncbi:cytochrome c [Nitrosomonas sp. sh817]|mgnify:CR=1 FL=1|jgi:cytochrome c553|uniref:c-type cytochrome n=1 Tax=unclassified Nitrosomonas TaxID=2609265 RepID=UPI0027DB62D3|nr:c-type cytochrome [Nitrosomonas sp. sh817]WMJ07808.1 c-type cytochrome [Nitrosomonas sp. sh817]